MTADPAAVIAAALDERSARKHGPRGQIDDIIRAAHADIGKAAVAALEAAGWTVVRVEETRTEWACQRAPRWGSTITAPMGRVEARDFFERTGPEVVASVLRRPVYIGPWGPVDDDA